MTNEDITDPHTAYAGLVAGIYHYKPGTKEIVTHKKTILDTIIEETVEIIDTETKSWVSRIYHDNNLIHETHYKDDKMHGKNKCWYEGSYKKAYEDDYKNGKMHGKHISWSEDGIKLSEVNYHNGERHGKEELWYFNGTKSLEGYYQNGKCHGKHIYWWKNGVKRREEIFVNGKKVSYKAWNLKGEMINNGKEGL